MEIEKNTVVTIKLASGEEVIAKYVGSTESEINVEKPLAIMMSPQGLAFATFAPTMDHSKGVRIARQGIITMGPALDKLATEYANATSPIKTAGKPNLIIK